MPVLAGGTVEAALVLWASSLRDVKGRIKPLFQQERTALCTLIRAGDTKTGAERGPVNPPQ